jgi:nicotinate-nucleotide pyrophosphorylase
MQASATGGIAVVDELDLAVQSLVLPEIARWFRDPARNKQNAQLWTIPGQTIALLIVWRTSVRIMWHSAHQTAI